jgi:formylglycine-generating enzyme required for sulfatase activity
MRLEKRKEMKGYAYVLTVTTCAIICIARSSYDRAMAAPAEPDVEAQIAQLKSRTAVLVASGRARLDALSPQERLAAPPAIWKLPDAIAEFKDCAECPQMVVIPAGEYTMGSPPSEQNAEAQHRVTITAPFAVSKFEITFDDWDLCSREGGCGGDRLGDNGWGRGKRPAIHISWGDAKAYVSWLSNKTGKRYRLLSESEWEYAARAGTTTRFSFGDILSPSQANYDGSTDGSGPSDVNRQKTMPVGSFPANGFGLHDMHGNVSEWVEDCWHNEYTATAPVDGSPWLEGNCDGRVMRGGSWEDSEEELRSAARIGEYRNNSSYVDGFRIARGL